MPLEGWWLYMKTCFCVEEDEDDDALDEEHHKQPQTLLQLVLPVNAQLLALWALATVVVYAAVEAAGLSVFGLNVMFLITSILSAIGSVLTLLSSFKVNLKRKPAFHLVYANAAADLGFAIKFLMSSALCLAGNDGVVTTGHWLCWLSAALGQFFGLATVSWSSVLSLNLLLMVIDPLGYGRQQASYFKYYHVFVWGLSALTFMLAAVTGHVGFTTDGTCWLEGGYIFLFYVPLYIYWVFCFVSLIVVAKTLSSMQSTSNVVTTTIKRSVSLTLAFVLMWLWGAIFRIHEYTNSFIPAWLIFIQAFYLGAGGFVNFCIWYPQVVRAVVRMRNSIAGTTQMSTMGKVFSSSRSRSKQSREVQV